MKATPLTLLSLALPSLAGAQGAPYPLWGEVIDGNHSTPLAVLSDGLGGAFIGGTAEGSFGGPGAGGIDAFVEHRDAAGRSTFLTRFGASGDEDVADLVADGAGGFYVVGAASGPLGGVGAGASRGQEARLLASNSACLGRGMNQQHPSRGQRGGNDDRE